jgi:hypothetical protein
MAPILTNFFIISAFSRRRFCKVWQRENQYADLTFRPGSLISLPPKVKELLTVAETDANYTRSPANSASIMAQPLFIAIPRDQGGWRQDRSSAAWEKAEENGTALRPGKGPNRQVCRPPAPENRGEAAQLIRRAIEP